MQHRVGHALLGLSLLLCLATLSLWVRSYFKSDSIDRFRRDAGGEGAYHDTTSAFTTSGLFGAGYLRLYHPMAGEPALAVQHDSGIAAAVAAHMVVLGLQLLERKVPAECRA